MATHLRPAQLYRNASPMTFVIVAPVLIASSGYCSLYTEYRPFDLGKGGRKEERREQILEPTRLSAGERRHGRGRLRAGSCRVWADRGRWRWRRRMGAYPGRRHDRALRGWRGGRYPGGGG